MNLIQYQINILIQSLSIKLIQNERKNRRNNWHKLQVETKIIEFIKAMPFVNMLIEYLLIMIWINRFEL